MVVWPKTVTVPLRPGHLQRRLLEQPQALAASCQPGELLQQRGHRDREGERGEREVDAREPQRRQADQEADDAGGDPGQRDRPDVAPVLVHRERRGRVAADRHQRAVAERDLARVAGEDVQPDDRDEEDARLREVARVEVADEVRRQRVEHEHRGRGQRTRARSRARAFIRASTSTRPKRPVGLTSSTPRITASATGSRRSVPIQST